MKHFKNLLFTAAIVLLFATAAQAQANRTRQTKSGNPRVETNRPGFADADNNGICDNLGRGRNQGRGTAFADKNNDGICDNRSALSGKGNAYRHQGQAGQCGHSRGANHTRGNRR